MILQKHNYSIYVSLGLIDREAFIFAFSSKLVIIIMVAILVTFSMLFQYPPATS